MGHPTTTPNGDPSARLSTALVGLMATFSVALGACSDANSGGGDGFNASSGGTSSSGGTGGGLIGFGGSSNGGGGKLNSAPPCSATDPNVDADGDGFTPGAGDCNDCTDQMNPGAMDFPANGVDEDCNGTPDDEPTGCDATVADLASTDPYEATKALGLCRPQVGDSWGVISARYVMADGSVGMNSRSHGVLPTFGTLGPREGGRMLALSSGTARAPGNPGWEDPEGAEMGTTGNTPPGFPVPAPACPGQSTSETIANDSAALEVTFRSPTNANAVRFDFNFHTYEFPLYVCSTFNDFFVALLTPAPQGTIGGNVSFDNQGNPVSVNNGYLEVCSAQTAGALGTDPKFFDCPQGPSQLLSTGFDNAGATGWLVTEAPIPKGQNVTLRFAIWDAGDDLLDSTVLIDNMTFDIGEGNVPVTVPVPK